MNDTELIINEQNESKRQALRKHFTFQMETSQRSSSSTKQSNSSYSTSRAIKPEKKNGMTTTRTQLDNNNEDFGSNKRAGGRPLITGEKNDSKSKPANRKSSSQESEEKYCDVESQIILRTTTTSPPREKSDASTTATLKSSLKSQKKSSKVTQPKSSERYDRNVVDLESQNEEDEDPLKRTETTVTFEDDEFDVTSSSTEESKGRTNEESPREQTSLSNSWALRILVLLAIFLWGAFIGKFVILGFFRRSSS